ncbi:PREDICTED: uncharacterized protein LOC109487473 [Branchiostoma belcheri]|uniref:Uncharacterized protein LOC109487473 n=1 Tax=Branchiostoma belcheri TaxID=7741 RepID=A0A6P5AVB0_BRABE|nr:PREDICTED: uncharacterized protein LOC109487473 [Branchiostoma belcheri]
MASGGTQQRRLRAVLAALAALSAVHAERTPRQAAPQCEDIRVPMCRNLPYKQTMYPKGTGNALGHRTQEDAVRFIAQHQLQRLVESDCSPDLRLFFCSVFVPACTPTGEIVPPCRTLCQATRHSCRGVLQRENIRWPRELQCGRYPIPGTGKGCTEGLQSAQHSAGGQHQVGITPLSANDEEPVMVHTMDYLTEFKKPSAELVRGVRGQAVLLRGKYLESDQPLNVCGQKYVFCPDGFAVEFWMKRWLNDKRPHYYVDIGGDRTELARGFTFLRARDQVDREDQFTVQVSGSRTAQRGRVDIPLQTWTHVAFYWKEGTQLTILVNGTRAGYNFEERRLKPLTRRATGNPYRLFYGTSAMRPGGMTPSYTALDEVKIWGYVRPEEDIKQSLDEFLADTEGGTPIRGSITPGGGGRITIGGVLTGVHGGRQTITHGGTTTTSGERILQLGLH